MVNKKKILSVGAHPDDLDFSSSGTLARFIKQGSEVFYLIVSDGSKGGNVVGFGGSKLAKIRRKEQIKAANALGVEGISFLGLKDGEVENTRSLRRQIVKEVRRVRPDIVFCFDPANLSFDNPYRSHRDHRQAGEAVFDAVYPASGSVFFFPELLRRGFRPCQPREIWFFGSPKPNKLVDIDKTIGKKIEALFCHESQLPDKKEVEKRIRDWARKTGVKKGLKYAEAFRVINFLR